MPVEGSAKLTEKGKQIYSLVLEMQQLSDLVSTGTSSSYCHQNLVEGFLDLGLSKGSKDGILRSGISSAFFAHGVGHSLWMHVHDDLNQQITRLFHKTWTVVPGIYFYKHLLKVVEESEHVNHNFLKEYRAIGGMPIEDDILMTPDGCENLTEVRNDVEWLESVCSGEI
ncbi:peptidase M24, structural domain-containing protein [Suillus subluteus]|nr:peptidase M24, structural domain-containing protein [Suillus subluteus]